MFTAQLSESIQYCGHDCLTPPDSSLDVSSADLLDSGHRFIDLNYSIFAAAVKTEINIWWNAQKKKKLYRAKDQFDESVIHEKTKSEKNDNQRAAQNYQNSDEKNNPEKRILTFSADRTDPGIRINP